MLVDNSHFQQNLNLPETDANKAYGQYLKDRIAALEPQFLTDVLGYDMYTTLKANENATSGIWYELLNGKAFTDKFGVSTYFKGLKVTSDNPIASYVYCNMLEEKSQTVTTLGVMTAANENSQPISPDRLIRKAWNSMVESLWIMDDFIQKNKASYTTYIGVNNPPFIIRGNSYPGYTNNKYFQLKNTFDI
jgi:hypothetical protein